VKGGYGENKRKKEEIMKKSAYGPLTVVPKPEYSRPKPGTIRMFRKLIAAIEAKKKLPRRPR
jgi:hypothetical protein